MLKANHNSIFIKGAKVHNLKNITLRIPKNKLVVITGLSGSGKSSLAMDTIYAEAERRFVESLSSYARQFLGVKERPDVDEISGLSPAIAIDQKSLAKNPRSTVGTITEIYDYLRILFSRVGTPHCPNCGQAVKKQSIDEIVKSVLGLPKQSQIMILAPAVRDRKGEHKKVFENILHQGFLRVRLDGEVLRLEEAQGRDLNPKKKHVVEVVVDRLTIDADTERLRLADSLESALKIGGGVVLVVAEDGAKKGASDGSPKEILFSEHFACPVCHISLPEVEPRLFSFNSPYGACQKCTGLGRRLEVDSELVVPNKNLTLGEGAIRPWARASHRVGRQSWYWWTLSEIASKYNFSSDVPFKDLPKEAVKIILYGDPDGKFEGVIPNLERRWRETDSEWTRAEIERYMRQASCFACGGRRLKPEALAVLLGAKNIAEISAMQVDEVLVFVNKLRREFAGSSAKKTVAEPLLKEIANRLQFLIDVGLEYLSLERESTTLGGGEAQRVRLATQIGSGLSGVIYVLDEPSIGLHPRDHARLLATLKRLRDLGNSIIVIEHDAETMKEADWIVDLGPGAGRHGGKIVFEGTFRQLLRSNTLTGNYLSGKKKVEISVSQNTKFSAEGGSASGGRIPNPKQIPKFKLQTSAVIKILGAREHNLKNIDAEIPLGKFVGISGVSGSGKSTLINDILATALYKHFYGSRTEPGRHEKITGIEHLDKVVMVDQSPIGRTPRSNPATYTGTFSFIRDIFAKTREAKIRGYKAGRFSFNVKGGRCEECEGHGLKKIEMYFLPDIYVECEECGGKRYNKEALEITYQNLNVAAVLDLSVEEALPFFKNIPQIKIRLETLLDVGLGYVKLGQAATTLSGGEAQRIKLADELSRKATGKTLYILDEPTTGLHFEDIRKLLRVLRALVDKGNTVAVIEHNPDVLKNADWIIDLGPEGGDGGGKIIVSGTPQDIARNKESYTGQWLKKNWR